MRGNKSVALKNLPSDMNRNRMRPSKGRQVVTGPESCTKSWKLQSAVEYLSTYAWAILIISLALAILVGYGILNPSTFGAGSSKCLASSDFSCTNATLSTTGNLVVTIGQSTSSPIYLTSIACNSVIPAGNAFFYSYPGIFLPIGDNVTTSTQCYYSSGAFSGKVGVAFTGYLVLTYNSISTGFNQTVVDPLSVRVSH
jgi:hypothetical protein